MLVVGEGMKGDSSTQIGFDVVSTPRHQVERLFEPESVQPFQKGPRLQIPHVLSTSSCHMRSNLKSHPVPGWLSPPYPTNKGHIVKPFKKPLIGFSTLSASPDLTISLASFSIDLHERRRRGALGMKKRRLLRFQEGRNTFPTLVFDLNAPHNPRNISVHQVFLRKLAHLQ